MLTSVKRQACAIHGRYGKRGRKRSNGVTNNNNDRSGTRNIGYGKETEVDQLPIEFFRCLP